MSTCQHTIYVIYKYGNTVVRPYLYFFVHCKNLIFQYSGPFESQMWLIWNYKKPTEFSQMFSQLVKHTSLKEFHIEKINILLECVGFPAGTAA